MITIDEKLKLFTKIVYDKVDKESQKLVESFNNEYGNLVEQKKQEFIKEANAMLLQSQKKIVKEKLHIISKARIEEKRIIMEKKMKIYEETVKELIEYAKVFAGTEEYKEIFFRDFRNAILEMNECSSMDIYLTQRDMMRFKDEILSITADKTVVLHYEDEIAGGFIILDNRRNIKLDMSFSSRIQNSKDYLGQKLFETLLFN